MTKNENKDKLVVIDGNAILHRAYHALPYLTAKGKEPINAVYGLVSMLLRIIDDLRPSHLVVCFDRKEPTFRHKSYEKYQAQRPPMEKNLSSQFAKAKDFLKASNILIFEKPGYEADDLIGTISKKAEKKFQEIIIVTGDKDILQLVTKKTSVYLPVRGLSEAKLMKEDDVEKKLGIKPSQIIDYKSLVGDSSDNYPGVYGIGPKTAVTLLKKYKSKSGVYKNLSKIDKRVVDKLKKGKEEADISYHLAKIVTNVKISVDFNELSDWELASKKTLDLFSKYGFKTLTKRIKKTQNDLEKEDQESLF